MKKNERKEHILELLQENGRISVEALSRQLAVSTVTIRTDLKELEAAGTLYRTHGGAVCDSTVRLPEAPEDPVGKWKMQIAQCAARQVRSGSWIYLGSGSTCMALAQQLASHPVNIMTNSLDSAQALAHSASVQLLMPGGSVFNSSHPFLYGDLLYAALSSIVFEQAYVGVSGIDPNFGFSVSNTVECSVIKRLRQIAKELIVVADAGKFGRVSFMGAGPLSTANRIITAGPLTSEHEEWCRNAGVRLLRADMPSAG